MPHDLNHVAIAVPDLEAAAAPYRALGLPVSAAQALPEHGVTVAFVQLGNTKLELLEPLGADSPIASFLERHPAGGLHHICLQVADLEKTCAEANSAGIRSLGPPKIGAHGLPVVFLHPKDLSGTLVELEAPSPVPSS